MSKLPIRAGVFALLALVVIAIVSAIVLLMVVGLPDPKAGAASFTAEAAQVATKVDMGVGAVVMLALGWLTARPFFGRDAFLAAVLFAIFYMLFDMAVVAAIGRTSALDVNAVLTTYAVKAGAALVGGALAARRSATA